MAGEHDAADELMAATESILRGIDDRLALRTFWTPQRLVQLRLREDVEALVISCRDGRTTSATRGTTPFSPPPSPNLPDVLVDDDPEQAQAFLDEAAVIASPDDMVVQAFSRAVLAKSWAAAGRFDLAANVAAEAAALLEPTDSLCDRARVAIATARVRELSGDDTGMNRSLEMQHASSSPRRTTSPHSTRWNGAARGPSRDGRPKVGLPSISSFLWASVRRLHRRSAWRTSLLVRHARGGPNRASTRC